MRYEEPRMEVLELEAEDVVTGSLTNGGQQTGNETGENLGNNNWD